MVGKIKKRPEQVIQQVASELEIRILKFIVNPDHVYVFIQHTR